MKKITLFLIPALLLALSGCGGTAGETAGTTAGRHEGTAAVQETGSPEMETVPAATVAENGDPDSVTCLGSYTGTVDSDAVIARAGSEALTVQELQVWYWARVAQYRQEGHEENPDYDQPLDTQRCPIDQSVNSWQQYFLQKALGDWHTAAALVQHSREVPLQYEEAYQPNPEKHAEYMTGMPATEFLYGYEEFFDPNSMHQAYLDAQDSTLDALARDKGLTNADAMAAEAFGVSEAALSDMVQRYNLGYMYFTELSFDIEPTAEELAAWCDAHTADFASTGASVDFRHVLLIPENASVTGDGTVNATEDSWTACEAKAKELLTKWSKLGKQKSVYSFGEIAVKHSADTGTALNGGAYYGITRGRLIPELESWCFDAGRQVGDTAIFRSDYGVHMVCFEAVRDTAYALAEDAYFESRQAELLRQIRQDYPLSVTWEDITLGQSSCEVSLSDLLYPDVAHERFPEVPLYLQQDYPDTKYGAFSIVTNGCGITTLAMLASYMSDDELTPPELCAKYGHYSHRNGTDGMIFNYEPSSMGFYLREKNYDHREVKQALEEGQIVVCIQHPGYWTRGGHYLVVEHINDEDMVQVRDSNIYNYGRLDAHLNDLHKWTSVTANGMGFWIYEDKVTYIPACCRCGTGEAITQQLLDDEYLCEKCEVAARRRSSYLHSEA